MNSKYLPIGTVVILKGATKRVMITGFCIINKDKMYDYTGCLYPEGFVTTKDFLIFNHEDIDKIYYMGLSDDDDKKFKEHLNKLVEDYNSKKQ